MAQETKDSSTGTASSPGPEARKVDAWLAAERDRLRPWMMAVLARKSAGRGERA